MKELKPVAYWSPSGNLYPTREAAVLNHEQMLMPLCRITPELAELVSVVVEWVNSPNTTVQDALKEFNNMVNLKDAVKAWEAKGE